MYHSLFIHSSWSTSSLLPVSGSHLAKSMIAGSFGKMMFSFVRNCQIVFRNGWPCILASNAWEFLLLHSPVSSWYCRYIVIFHRCLNLQFPNDKWCWASFHTLICVCTSILVRCPPNHFWPLLMTKKPKDFLFRKPILYSPFWGRGLTLHIPLSASGWSSWPKPFAQLQGEDCPVLGSPRIKLPPAQLALERIPPARRLDGRTQWGTEPILGSPLCLSAVPLCPPQAYLVSLRVFAQTWVGLGWGGHLWFFFDGFNPVLMTSRIDLTPVCLHIFLPLVSLTWR